MIHWLTDALSNHPYVVVFLLTLLPFLELRASIPYGILAAKQPWLPVFAVAVASNILIGPILYWLLDRFLHVVLRVKWIERLWNRKVEKLQKKIHAKVERYGVAGLGIFIGVPLPGSGVYSGAIGGYLLGFSHRKFLWATIMGVVIAGIIVLIVTLTGSGMFHFLIKDVAATTQPGA